MSAGTKLVLVLTILILALIAAYHGAAEVPGMSGVRDAGATLLEKLQRTKETVPDGADSTLATTHGAGGPPPAQDGVAVPDVTPSPWDPDAAMRAMNALEPGTATTALLAPSTTPEVEEVDSGTMEEIRNVRRHTVGPGQTLWEIARIRMGTQVRWEELASFNGLDEEEPLQVGQVLLIPDAAVASAVTAKVTHHVRGGETLSSIADTYLGSPTRWRELYEFNRTTLAGGPDTLAVGMELSIPGR